MICLVIYCVDIPLVIKITDECLHHKSFYSKEKSALKFRGKVKSHSGLNIPHGAAEIASLWLAAWLINLVTCWFADWLDFGLTDCSACTPIIHLCVKDPLSKRPNLIWRTLHMWNSSTATHTSLHYTTGVCMCAFVERRPDTESKLDKDLNKKSKRKMLLWFTSLKSLKVPSINSNTDN